MSTGIIYSCKLGSSPSLNHGYSLNSLLKHQILQLFLVKPSIQKIDADGDEAPTIFLPWPSPSPNARRDKISRKGKPLNTWMSTHMVPHGTTWLCCITFPY